MKEHTYSDSIAGTPEAAIRAICEASAELLEGLSASERLVVADVRRRCGVKP
jgi:hypothetical protein